MSSGRVIDYFFVAGLPDNPTALDLSSDSPTKPAGRNEPITDICVVIPNHGEECPPGYKLLLETPTGQLADLNHGSLRSPEIFICIRRGRDKSPLTDIGVLYEGSERVLRGCEVVYTTPYGRPANINNTANRIYLTYRRASEGASSDALAVTDVCVINASKGEKPPHSFCKIDKNLNQAMMSSSIYLCYKKSMCKNYSIAYKPGVLSRYPQWDWPDYPVPLDDSVAMFGLPMGAVLESWSEKAAQPKSVFATFVLTLLDGKKVYGAAVTFYELYDKTESLDAAQRKSLGLHLKKKRLVHVNKAICVLASRPFFPAFRKFLMYLYQLALSPECSPIPIERLVSHFMWEVPFPSPDRPYILAQLSDNCTVDISLPDESPIPLSGASFATMLKNLGVENTVSLLTATLLESKILIHSLRPAVLTGVIEAVGSMIFPFSWKCPYIPLCPLGLTQMIFAPVPYIFGVDSRYFDSNDPPTDVICIDLDTNTISKPSDNKLLPKRPAKVLRATLEKLYYQILADQSTDAKNSGDVEKRAMLDSTRESLIQEAFLRFMAAILKGYKGFLLPITSAPSETSTSVKELFDIKGFIKSRDKAYHKLYEQMVRTQAFASFIEERSFNTRNDTSLLFFDECAESVDENYDTPKLLDIDSHKSGRTVFVSPPLPPDTEEKPPVYTYGKFPDHLDHELFPHKEKPAGAKLGPDAPTTLSIDGKSFIARRSKVEVKASLKLASMSRKGVASSTLWSKCLVSNTFSLWFAHLPALIQASQSPQCAMRAAYAVLKKMQEYRLYTPDEMCFRTMMQLCGIYKMPMLAVKVLCEMRSIGLNANAITYGYYNKAVLESKWPEESSNAQRKWRQLRHIILGVTQFKKALRNRRSSIDLDSLSRGSENSNDLTLDSNDVSSVAKGHRGSANAVDVGYGSMSQEDIQKCSTVKTSTPVTQLENDAFRVKVGSIVKKSISREDSVSVHNMDGSRLESAAGLLITAKRIVRRVPLGGSLNTDQHRQQFAEVRRKRHKSAGDHLKKTEHEVDVEEMTEGSGVAADADSQHLLDKDKSMMSAGSSQPTLDRTKDTTASVNLIDLNDTDSKNDGTQAKIDKDCMSDPLNGASVVATATSTATTATGANAMSNPLLDSMLSSTDSLKKELVMSDDPLGLFSTVTPDNEGSTSKTNDISADSVNSISPQNSIKSMDIGNLFGRSSTSQVADEDVKKYNLLQLSPDSETPEYRPSQLKKSMSLDSRNSYKEAIKEDDASATNSSEGQTCQQEQQANNVDYIGSKESLASVNSGDSSSVASTKSSAYNYKDWVAASLKKSTSGFALTKNLSSKMKSMVYGEKSKSEPINAASSHDSLDSVGNTPKAVRGRNDDMRASLKKIKSVSSSMASKLLQATTANYKHLKHTVKEYQAPSTISMPYKDGKDARNSEDNISVSSLHSALGAQGSITEDGTAGHDEHEKPFDVTISYDGVAPTFISKYLPASSKVPVDSSDGVFTFNTANSPVLSVVICSATLCENCTAILYDEDIMAGWSAQDSDLSTTCRFCDKKQVPFIQVEIKDLRVKPNSSRLSSASDGGFMSAPPLSPPHEPGEGPETIKLPYLSPLVLRKELELVLDREGDVALTTPDFVDNHAIIYWNLMWYFKRMGVPTHLPQLLFQSKTLKIEELQTTAPQTHDMSLRVVWDNPKLRDASTVPMYKLWKESAAEKSMVVQALVSDDMAKHRAFMLQILNYVECNNMLAPIRQILNNRQLQAKGSTRFESAYRDILFLSFAYFGRDTMDHDAFDREYKLAYKRLQLTEKESLLITDSPPTPTVMWCRKLFGTLDVT